MKLFLIIGFVLWTFSGLAALVNTELKQAIGWYSQGKYQKSYEILEALLNDETLTENQRAKMHFYLAEASRQLGQYFQAIKHYKILKRKYQIIPTLNMDTLSKERNF